MPEVSLDHVQIAAPAGCEADFEPARKAHLGPRLGTADPWGNRIEFLASAAS